MNMVQGSREGRAALSPNREVNRSISGSKDDKNNPQPRQHTTTESPSDSSPVARPSRYRGGVAGYSNSTLKAKGMVRAIKVYRCGAEERLHSTGIVCTGGHLRKKYT